MNSNLSKSAKVKIVSYEGLPVDFNLAADDVDVGLALHEVGQLIGQDFSVGPGGRLLNGLDEEKRSRVQFHLQTSRTATLTFVNDVF